MSTLHTVLPEYHWQATPLLRGGPHAVSLTLLVPASTTGTEGANPGRGSAAAGAEGPAEVNRVAETASTIKVTNGRRHGRMALVIKGTPRGQSSSPVQARP